MRKLKLEELNRISLEDFKTAEKIPVCVILDDIRSMHNIGSVFRTADAFRLEKIYLCGITAQPPHKEIRKTALGATESVPWEYVENALDIIQKLKEQDYEIVAIEQVENSILLSEHIVNPAKKTVLIFGNEVEGVQQKIIDVCDYCLEIPQIGTKHSLNVSVCMGIVAWEYFNTLTY